MPNPDSVHALREFDSLAEANLYIDGIQAGLRLTNPPEPIRVRYEQDPIDKKHRVYIQLGYWNSAGEVCWR